MKIEVLYICDRKKPCRLSTRCQKECTHTKDIKHAANYNCEPRDKSRFKATFWRKNESIVAVTYYEKEIQ